MVWKSQKMDSFSGIFQGFFLEFKTFLQVFENFRTPLSTTPAAYSVWKGMNLSTKIVFIAKYWQANPLNYIQIAVTDVIHFRNAVKDFVKFTFYSDHQSDPNSINFQLFTSWFVFEPKNLFLMEDWSLFIIKHNGINKKSKSLNVGHD